MDGPNLRPIKGARQFVRDSSTNTEANMNFWSILIYFSHATLASLLKKL